MPEEYFNANFFYGYFLTDMRPLKFRRSANSAMI